MAHEAVLAYGTLEVRRVSYETDALARLGPAEFYRVCKTEIAVKARVGSLIYGGGEKFWRKVIISARQTILP